MQPAVKRGVICKYLLPDGKCEKDKRAHCKFNPEEKPGWFDERFETIDRGEICGRQSIFGNQFISVTREQLDALKLGKVLYIGGEYGIFIALE